MANKKTPSPSDKAQSLRYKSENRAVKNRTKRLEKHIENFPNDDIAKSALKRGLSYRRQKPVHKYWKSSATKLYAQQLAFVGGNGNDALKHEY